MDNPLVSIVTITRNRGKLIGRCIDSVLNQTYPFIEHIVVDGASDDETDEVVSHYNDERLRFVKLDYNWPIDETYKYGASLAKGSFICFLDSDDEFLPTKIEKQLNLISSLPSDYGMVYCWMTFFDSSKNNAIIRIHKPQLRGYVPLEAAEKPTVSGTPTFFFRKKVFDELGGWNWDMPIASDFELGARCCQKYKVDYVPESLVNVYENHCYVRSSYLINKDKEWTDRRVGMHQYMLNEFKDIFDKYPRHKSHHINRMIYYSIKGGKYLNAIKFSIMYIKAKIFGI